MLRTQRIAVGATAGAFVLALAVSGCGSGSGSGSGSTSTTSPGTSSSSSSGAAKPAADTLSTAKVDKVGTVVVDGKGFVLYRFDKDTAKPTPKSNCYGTCAAQWPPAPATGNVTVKGIDKSLVGTVTRNDGTKQLTLAGWPLYRYAKDDEPHEAYGQGVGGIWFAATPTGAKAMTSDTGSSSGGGSGY
uniref:Lipoprotein n=1 Tax=Streptomyces sp. NBC_00003 TaxID=2903608 RepID=A0AAU2V3Y1_9ACTN